MSEKTPVTQQQRDNAMDALTVMWPSVPPANVNRKLAVFRSLRGTSKVDCNTVACFGGWCAVWPPFVAQGICADHEGFPIFAATPTRLDAGRVSFFLFGYSDMFAPRGAFDAIEEPNIEFGTSDHEIITARLRWLIESSEVVKDFTIYVVEDIEGHVARIRRSQHPVAACLPLHVHNAAQTIYVFNGQFGTAALIKDYKTGLSFDDFLLRKGYANMEDIPLASSVPWPKPEAAVPTVRAYTVESTGFYCGS